MIARGFIQTWFWPMPTAAILLLPMEAKLLYGRCTYVYVCYVFFFSTIEPMRFVRGRTSIQPFGYTCLACKCLLTRLLLHLHDFD